MARWSRSSADVAVLRCLHAQDVTERGRYYPHQWPEGAEQGIIEFLDLLVG